MNLWLKREKLHETHRKHLCSGASEDAAGRIRSGDSRGWHGLDRRRVGRAQTSRACRAGTSFTARESHRAFAESSEFDITHRVPFFGQIVNFVHSHVAHTSTRLPLANPHSDDIVVVSMTGHASYFNFRFWSPTP